jgi:hypothetical protein
VGAVVLGAAAGSDKADSLEDESAELLWQWELRDVKALPKADRGAAAAHKKLMHKARAAALPLLCLGILPMSCPLAPRLQSLACKAQHAALPASCRNPHMVPVCLRIAQVQV